MQLGQSNISSNNGWSGMLTQNLQPAPGSNPFFNLASQQQQQSVGFGGQVYQLFIICTIWKFIFLYNNNNYNYCYIAVIATNVPTIFRRC